MYEHPLVLNTMHNSGTLAKFRGLLSYSIPAPSPRRNSTPLSALETLETRVLPAAALPFGSELHVNTVTNGNQHQAATAIDSAGNFVVVWTSDADPAVGNEIFAQRYNAIREPVGSEFRINTTTSLDQKFPDVAMDAAGNFVVVWEGTGQEGDSTAETNIYAQRFDSLGNPIESEFRVNSLTTGNQFDPKIASDSVGNFIVAWTDASQDGDAPGVFAQRFNSEGASVGSVFRVNSFTTGEQSYPDVAANASGEFVITWSSFDQDGSSGGIYAQRYDSAGQTQGSEFLVNTSTFNNQASSVVALDETGNFVIAWHSTAGGFHIRARRFADDGTPQAADFRVDAMTSSTNSLPSVGMDAQGNFVILWTGNPGSDADIYGRKFDATGVAIGTEFIANSRRFNGQSDSTIAMNRDGTFIAAWTSGGQDGTGDAVIAQLFREKNLDSIGTHRGFSFYLDSDKSRSWSGPQTDTLYANFGNPSDTPLIGDWDGNGFEEIGVWRAGTFFLDVNGNGLWDPNADNRFNFGLHSDLPITGDWNGDGIVDVGVRRGNRFYLDADGNSRWENGIDQVFAFGLDSDTPLVGDWNADRVSDVAVWRAGRFYLDTDGNRTWNGPTVDHTFLFGNSTDFPVVGDWNNDGIDDVGIRRNRRYWVDLNGNRAWDSSLTDAIWSFGSAGDTSLIGAWRPNPSLTTLVTKSPQPLRPLPLASLIATPKKTPSA